MQMQRRQMMTKNLKDEDQAASTIQARVRGRQARSALEQQKLDMAAALIAEVAKGDLSLPEVGSAWPGAGDSKDEPSDGGDSIFADLDRERLCCDVLNTSVMAALVGGFALSNMVAPGESTIEYVIYTMSCFAVHACTCSALTSALLYRTVVRMKDECVAEWAGKPMNKMLLMMPLMKFGMGCVSYLGSVIVLSWKDQSYSPSGEALFFRLLCLVIGVMSMSTVLMTCVVIFGKEALPKRKPPKRLTRVAPH